MVCTGQGAIADAFKVTLVYGGGAAAGPNSVVVKLSKEDETIRQDNAELYEREVMVYSKLAEGMPGIRMAKCYGTFFDKSKGTHCIVLEDCMAMDGGEVTGFPYWMMCA